MRAVAARISASAWRSVGLDSAARCCASSRVKSLSRACSWARPMRGKNGFTGSISIWWGVCSWVGAGGVCCAWETREHARTLHSTTRTLYVKSILRISCAIEFRVLVVVREQGSWGHGLRGRPLKRRKEHGYEPPPLQEPKSEIRESQTKALA